MNGSIPIFIYRSSLFSSLWVECGFPPGKTLPMKSHCLKWALQSGKGLVRHVILLLLWNVLTSQILLNTRILYRLQEIKLVQGIQ